MFIISSRVIYKTKYITEQCSSKPGVRHFIVDLANEYLFKVHEYLCCIIPIESF